MVRSPAKQAQEADAEAQPRVIGGRYAVESLLGHGGVGSVYAVVDESSGARLALKRLRADAGERAAQLFDREYRILAGLRHPCIVEVYDYGVDEAGAYYTMELVDGRDLSARAPLAWRAACMYLRDAASILGILHVRRLLHRDLSPRNLIESKSGRLKLIDFGALADFGPALDVAGTPPYVPPEAIRTGRLDQRSDLFALGALGYWLITGCNAFQARSLADLPEQWQREPAPASTLVRAIGNDLLEAPPPELDALLAQLLRVDPKERIASTAELIDRLNAIAGLAPEAADEAVKSYLQSSAFVGRERELARVGEALSHAHAGRGGVVLIEGDAGVGRSRLVSELALNARLTGALTLTNDASLGRRAYALAQHLLAQLQRALPQQAQAWIEPHAQVLAPLSLMRSNTLAEQSFSEARARLQNALLAVFSQAARERCLALVIDDLHRSDEESRAVLNALAHRVSGLKLCVIASLSQDARRELSPAIVALRGVASVFRLAPLTAQQTRELLRSVFGEVAYLDRLSERLFRGSEGNPAHCLELAQHLVETRAAYYLEGSWNLPMELAAESLPLSRRAGLVSRLDRLPSSARALAQAMSVPHGACWTIDQVACAADVPRARAEEWLSLLVRERVLRSLEDGHAFAHDAVRENLHAELAEQRRREIHARLALALARAAAEQDVALTLGACAHALRAGELAQAYPLLKRALSSSVNGDPAHIGLHAPAFEEILGLLRDAGQDEYAQCGPLGMLSVAGYFADRRYALRYGEAALEALGRVLRIELAEQLARRFGPKVALFTALGVAAAGCMRNRARCMSVQDNVRLLLLAASTLAGTAAICMDPDRAGRYAKSLAPFAAFGPDHAASFVYDFTALMELQGRDRAARCVSAFQAMIRRLEDPRPIHELTDQVRSSYYAGVHLTLGVFLVRRDDRAGLALADKLEQFSPLYAMSADHLRANYYAAQGELAKAHAARQRMEVHAVQLGSAWQAETWAPVDVINIAFRMHDASEMKRAVRELARLSEDVPSLAQQELYARVTYLVLRERYAEAIALYAAADDPPYAMNGWMRTQGTLARAHNALGQHARAREICLHALAGADIEERQYVVMNLGVEIELALAEAGLGHFAHAHAELRRLLGEHAPNQSPVTLGSLHEARARVSLLEGDLRAAEAHVRDALALYEPLGAASLIGRARTLARQIEHIQRPTTSASADAREVRSQRVRRFELLLRERFAELDPARACLDALLELCDAEEVFFVFADLEAGLSVVSGIAAPAADLVAWAALELRPTDMDAETVVTTGNPRQRDAECKRVGDMHYRVLRLWSVREDPDAPAGALVLGAKRSVPSSLEPEMLKAIALHLAQAARVNAS